MTNDSWRGKLSDPRLLLEDIAEDLLVSWLCSREELRLHAASSQFLPRVRRDAEDLLQIAFQELDAHAALSAARRGAKLKASSGGLHQFEILLRKVAPASGGISIRARQCALGRVLMAVGHPSVEMAVIPWLSGAALEGNMIQAEFLLELRADINQQDVQHEYSTPLMLAVSGRALPHMKLSMCEALVSLGADLSTRRQGDGKTLSDIFRENVKPCRSWARLHEVLMMV